MWEEDRKKREREREIISTYLHFSSLLWTLSRTSALGSLFVYLITLSFPSFFIWSPRNNTGKKATGTALLATQNKNQRTFHFPLLCFAFIISEHQWIWSSIFWKTSKSSQNILQSKPWGDGDLPSQSSEIGDGGSETLQISTNAPRLRRRNSKSRFDFLRLLKSHDSYSYSWFQSPQCRFLFSFLPFTCLFGYWENARKVDYVLVSFR